MLSLVELDGDKLYSTVFVVGPDRKVAGQYRKVHLSRPESDWATAGSGYNVLQCRSGISA